MEFNGVHRIDTARINHAINVKNLLEFSKDYSDRVGPTMLHYIYTNTVVVVVGELMVLITIIILHREMQITMKDLLKDKSISASTSAAPVNVIITLYRFGFFDSFISPSGKVSIDIVLESDDSVIFRAGGDPGRYLVTRFVLWVPNMMFNARGEQMF